MRILIGAEHRELRLSKRSSQQEVKVGRFLHPPLKSEAFFPFASPTHPNDELIRAALAEEP